MSTMVAESERAQRDRTLDKNARARDWSEYRKRAYAEGKRFLDRVSEVLPAIAANRLRSEAEGKVPDETVELMREAGVFRTFTPTRYGGLEVDPASFFEGVMRIAEADSSAAWIAGQLNVHSFEVALMSEQMQDEFWGSSPDTVASSSYAPIGKFERVEGGFILNGTWTFSSGVDHAQWVLLGGGLYNFIVPITDVVIDHNSWDVQGLRGTGSKAVTLTDVFVPEHRVHFLEDTYNDANPGWEVNNRPLYWISFTSMFNATPVNTVIGTATFGLNHFIEQARSRYTRQGTGVAIIENPFLHLRLADCLTRLSDIRHRQLRNWREQFDRACHGEETPTLDRLRLRFETADAIATCFDLIHEIWPLAGAAATRSNNLLQLVYRDLMAARNHGSGGRELAAGQYIKALFGMELPPFRDFATLAYHK